MNYMARIEAIEARQIDSDNELAHAREEIDKLQSGFAALAVCNKAISDSLKSLIETFSQS